MNDNSKDFKVLRTGNSKFLKRYLFIFTVFFLIGFLGFSARGFWLESSNEISAIRAYLVALFCLISTWGFVMLICFFDMRLRNNDEKKRSG